MWGQGAEAARPAPDPRADPIEHGKARGVVVTRSPNSGLYIEHTPPVLLPPPPDMSARGQLRPRIDYAEAMVKRGEEQHAEATQALVEAQQHMVTAGPGDTWIEQGLLTASTAVTVAASRLEAFKAHRDKLLAQVAAWESSGDLDSYDAACEKQSSVGLSALLAPLEERAKRLGSDFGAVVADAHAVISEILAARQQASRLATTLGFTRHRDAGINAMSAAIKISRAFADGFKAAAPRLDLKRWILP